MLLVSALEDTVDVYSVLGALIMSNHWLHSLAVVQECFQVLLQVHIFSLVWVCTSSVSEFACHVIWLILLRVLVDSV